MIVAAFIASGLFFFASVSDSHAVVRVIKALLSAAFSAAGLYLWNA